MQNIKEKIIEFAQKEGIDLIGFASKARFKGLEARLDPFSIFPEAKTVILVGKRIARGALRGIEEGTNFKDYDYFGYRWLDDEFLALATYNVCRFIEDMSWEAVPIFNNPEQINNLGIPVTQDRVAPNVTPDFAHAVVACGLGEIGLSQVLLTKKYGPRQRFQMIITDAEIEEDPIAEGTVCDSCGMCAESCPLGAIDKDDTRVVEVCGKKMRVAKVDFSLCRVCQNGAFKNRLHDDAVPDRYAALCTRTCVAHLEEQERIDNVFETKFRKKSEWAIDATGNSVKK